MRVTCPSNSSPISGSLIMLWIHSFAFCIDSWLGERICTHPSSSISISTWQASMIDLIIFPLGPIISPIFSTGTWKASIRGAVGANSFLGSAMHSCIIFRIFKRALWALSRAMRIISLVMPSILISICIAVIPSRVPAHLKSISPKWSSNPIISVKTT